MLRKPCLTLLLMLPLLAGYALADEWNRTYQVGDKPNLRVDTNDAAIEVSRGTSQVIAVKIITEGISIGPGGAAYGGTSERRFSGLAGAFAAG